MGRLASLPVGAFVMAFRAGAVLRLAARVPGIKFPTRRLPDGTRVSDLPAGTWTASDAREISPSTNSQITTSRCSPILFPYPYCQPNSRCEGYRGTGHGDHDEYQYRDTKKSTPGVAMARPRPSPIPFPRPDPPRKTMSGLEMQVVELGGADP